MRGCSQSPDRISHRNGDFSFWLWTLLECLEVCDESYIWVIRFEILKGTVRYQIKCVSLSLLCQIRKWIQTKHHSEVCHISLPYFTFRGWKIRLIQFITCKIAVEFQKFCYNADFEHPRKADIFEWKISFTSCAMKFLTLLRIAFSCRPIHVPYFSRISGSS